MFFRRKPPPDWDDSPSSDRVEDKDTKLPKLAAQPPAVFLLAMLGGAVIDAYAVPLSIGLGWAGGVLGVLIVATGIALTMMAMQAYRKAASSPDPHHMPTALVVTGPYARTRNPLYLGTLMIMLGIGIGTNMPWFLIAAVPVMAIIHYGVVLREEAYLEDLFGERYRTYRAGVRRWV